MKHCIVRSLLWFESIQWVFENSEILDVASLCSSLAMSIKVLAILTIKTNTEIRKQDLKTQQLSLLFYKTA